MNGDAFSGLRSLTQVWLQGNICVDENFNNQNRITALPGDVTSKCGFCENNAPLEIQVCGVVKQVNKIAGEGFDGIVKLEKQQVEMLEDLKTITDKNMKSLQMVNTRQAAKIAKLDRELKDLMIENRRNVALIARLEAKLFAAEVAKAQDESQKEVLMEINEKLDKIRSDSCANGKTLLNL